MITANDMKKIAVKNRKELEQEFLQKQLKTIETINSFILKKAEEGENRVNFDTDDDNKIVQNIAFELKKAIQEKNYIYQSFVQRGFKFTIDANPSITGTLIRISWR